MVHGNITVYGPRNHTYIRLNIYFKETLSDSYNDKMPVDIRNKSYSSFNEILYSCEDFGNIDKLFPNRTFFSHVQHTYHYYLIKQVSLKKQEKPKCNSWIYLLLWIVY